MFFKYFSRQILFSRTFQDSIVYSSSFQACANPDQLKNYVIPHPDTHTFDSICSVKIAWLLELSLFIDVDATRRFSILEFNA